MMISRISQTIVVVSLLLYFSYRKLWSIAYCAVLYRGFTTRAQGQR